jgi:16S rRNA A1518/A1519 N6-dimethyltransferase RsmA/KsgA/DIM1 with predicted DNA glycosylase/AP lyase activity
MMIGPWFAVKIKRPLRRTDFWPFPNVDTVLLEVKHRTDPPLPSARRAEYEAYITRCFTDPKYFHETTGRIEKPSSLKVADWIELFLNRKEK